MLGHLVPSLPRPSPVSRSPLSRAGYPLSCTFRTRHTLPAVDLSLPQESLEETRYSHVHIPQLLLQDVVYVFAAFDRVSKAARAAQPRRS
jgi:hypothetical protein